MDTKKRVTTSVRLSQVEKKALACSAYDMIYRPTENIPSLVVNSFPVLGQLTALRFLEWVQQHPGGVISLPTGKTPEYFIKWVRHLMKTWQKPETEKTLVEWGIDPAVKPDMKSLHFVQIDEFYPISSAQTNSFCYYVKTYYLKNFGLDTKKALLIDPCKIGLSSHQTLESVWPDKRVDLTLRYRQPKTNLEREQKEVLERIDQWCMDYEDRIAELGGIGFFLGGIGPDGHIGFNISGSDHHSTTRLCPINYETQAAAAGDLGGIEIARRSHVITIGLRTITRNPDCTAIIMAAGEAKADVVAHAIQSGKDVRYPATSLQVLPGARFYLTEGAAKGLEERQYHRLRKQRKLSDADVEKYVIDLSVQKRKRLSRLSAGDFEQHRFAAETARKEKQPPSQLARQVQERLELKIKKGIEVLENTCFLHTEPHHDDIMLGYFGHLVRHFRKASNRHHFMTLTSGFTSVTNRFMEWQASTLQRFFHSHSFAALRREGYFDPDNRMARNRDVWQYLDGVAAGNAEMKDEGCARRFLRNLYAVYGQKKTDKIEKVLDDLLDYFRTQYPGKQDPPAIQQLKGMCREWEVECLWGYYGWNCDNVMHLRLGFYTGDVFTPQPTRKRDILPIVEQLERIHPDVVTVALDPEASGPDTHYKVLQAVSEAMQVYQQKTKRDDIRVWGYRNVWYRFEPSEANVFVPVSLNMFSVMHQSFENAFLSQKEASFPSYEHDGPFSELAQRIQVQQYQVLKTCLGREWFYNHKSPLIRATRGFVFLKEMAPDEFYQSCRTLRKSIEAFD
ncbi:MAG TPA: glucosamine-6-phosphate deaminase [Phycisphaerales bacterium]|nr:glucosamine-6-phosphate deaminase [Phycisphaerales bacterium]